MTFFRGAAGGLCSVTTRNVAEAVHHTPYHTHVFGKNGAERGFSFNRKAQTLLNGNGFACRKERKSSSFGVISGQAAVVF
jgi:hypothetical protein